VALRCVYNLPFNLYDPVEVNQAIVAWSFRQIVTSDLVIPGLHFQLLLFVLRSNIYSSNISNVKMLKMSLTLVVHEDSNPGAFEEDMISEIFLDF